MRNGNWQQIPSGILNSNWRYKRFEIKKVLMTKCISAVDGVYLQLAADITANNPEHPSQTIVLYKYEEKKVKGGMAYGLHENARLICVNNINYLLLKLNQMEE